MKQKPPMLQQVLPVALLLAVLCVPGTALAQNATAPFKHPVLQHRIDPGRDAVYENAVRRAMAMSEAEMLRLIPMKSPVLWCSCPNCLVGSQDSGRFDWSIDRPHGLRCRECGEVYPSAKYPAKWTATGQNALGETVTYQYYFDEKSGRDFWLEARADRFCRDWFVDQCLALARAYHATHKPEYARRAALILDRFAQAYPHMAVLAQWPYYRRQIVRPTPPYPNGGGKWGRWAADEVPTSLPEAYDLIHDSEELDKLTRELGTDIRRRIEKDFFRATVDYMFAFGKEPTGFHLNNMAPSYTTRIINLGRVLGEPAYVHWGYRWVQEIVRDGFFYDGMWHEAPSYHYQVLGGTRRVLATLRGYSDPPGYRGTEDGLQLKDLDPERDFPFLEKARRAPDLIAFPDGRTSPVHDTWARDRRSPAREQTVSTLLPGFGHASLGGGRGRDQIQAQLCFSGAYGHAHADNLHLTLFAKGGEMLSDLGYTHTKLRHWTISTVGHNTVAIDRKDQTLRDSDGDLLLFVPNLNGLSAVEARGERGYPSLAQVYRRQLMLVPVSDTDAYVVDLFRVQGGTTHDWLLHGSADADMTAECSLPLQPREGTLLEPGEKWVEPLGETSTFSSYGLMREARQAKSADPFQVTFRYAATQGPTANAGVRVHLLGGVNTETFLARSPRVRQAGSDDEKLYDYWMPQLVARRSGSAPLKSVFAAVHEPFRAQPFLRTVRSVSLDPAAEFGVALEVQHAEGTDTIISTLDEPPYPERKLANGLVLQGRLAVVRERAGRVVAAWLVDGTRLAKGDFTAKLDTPRYDGVLSSATRKADGAAADSFVTTALLPEGEQLAGQWMIVTHANGYTHGYEIARVERREGKSVIVLRDDHGLRINGDQTEEYYFPRRKITGPNRFVIAVGSRFPQEARP